MGKGRTRTNVLVVILMLSLICLISSIIFNGYNSRHKYDFILNKQIMDFSVKDFDMYECVRKLAVQERVLVGFEENELKIPKKTLEKMKKNRVNYKELRTKITLDLKDVTLEELLKEIMSADGSYFWEIENGVINILPKANEKSNKYSKSHLNERIEDFKIVSTHIFNATNNLGRKLKSENRWNCGYSVVSGYCMPWEAKNINRKISIEMKNVTARQVLNALVKADGNVYWTLTSFPNLERKMLDISPVDDVWVRLSESEIEAIRQTEGSLIK